MCTGRRYENELCYKGFFFRKIDSRLYTTVSDGELHCVFACGGKEYYVCFSGCSLKEDKSEEVPFLCWSPTLSFVLFGMLFNIFVCLKKHYLFQDGSSYHIHVNVIGFYLDKFNIPV